MLFGHRGSAICVICPILPAQMWPNHTGRIGNFQKSTWTPVCEECGNEIAIEGSATHLAEH
jgi:hypothetical protein